jgi:hypothetical protein
LVFSRKGKKEAKKKESQWPDLNRRPFAY